MSNDRRYPPGTVPAATVTLILIGLLLAAGSLIVSMLLRGCDHPAQVRPSTSATATPEVRSAAKGESVAQATGTQSLRATLRPVRAPQVNTPKVSNHADSSDSEAVQVNTPDSGAWELVIEASQSITAAASSSAQASASVDHFPDSRNMVPNHGRLGVIATTMPSIIAADVQLLQVDASPVTRWLVGVPLEVGVDVAGNLEAGAVGVSAGGKGFLSVGGWSRWDLGDRGWYLGVGLRF